MLYSLVGTSYNTVETVKPCLTSLISQLETKEMELVVCDSLSTDGTPDAIHEFQPFFKELKVISQKSSRGKGRQIAFNHSSGLYLIQFDLDAIYTDGLRRLVEWHRKVRPDYAIIAGNSIYPRFLIQQVGGWHDLNWSEDLDLWIRLTLTGKCKWYGYETNYNVHLRDLHKDRHEQIIRRGKRGYRSLRDLMALHRLSLTKYIQESGLKPKILLGLLAKVGSFTLRNVVDIRRYPRETIIGKNSIDLGLPGENFEWYPQGFLK
jgi:glycosyltransferase involved in cell wall biosynthesis